MFLLIYLIDFFSRLLLIVSVCLLLDGVSFYFFRNHFLTLLAVFLLPIVGFKKPVKFFRQVSEIVASAWQLKALKDSLPFDKNRIESLIKKAKALVLKAFPKKLMLFCGASALAAFSVFVRSSLYNMLPPPPELLVVPGDCMVPFGEKVNITVEGINFKPSRICLEYKIWNWERIYQKVNKENKVKFEIGPLDKDVLYRVRAGRVVSPVYKIKVVRPPTVLKVEFDVFPPAYTGLRPWKVKENTTVVEVPSGSKVKVKAFYAGTVLKAWALINGRKFPVDVKDKFLSLRVNVERDINFKIKLTGPLNLRNENPAVYMLKAIPDNPPVLDVILPSQKNIELENPPRVEVLLRVSDDYLVKEVGVEWRLWKRYLSKEKKGTLLLDGGFSEKTIKHLWKLSSIGMFPGDSVSFRFFARDSSGKLSFTEEYFASFPTLSELYKKLKEKTEEIASGLEELLQSHEELSEKLESAEEKAAQGSLSWEQQKEIQDISKEIERRIEKLEKRAEQLEEKALDPEVARQILEQVKQLRELLKKIKNQKLRSLLEKLSNLIERQKVSPQDIQNILKDQKSLVERLKKTVELLKKLVLQQSLQEMASKIEELREFQRSINQKVRSGEKPISDQDSMTKALKELSKNALELSKQASAYEQTRQLLQKTGEKLSQLSKSSSQASFVMKQNGDSLPLQEDILNQLSQLSAEWNQGVNNFTSEALSVVFEKLWEIFSEGTAIHIALGDLSNSFEDEKVSEFLLGVNESVKILKRKLVSLFSDLFFIPPQLFYRIDSVYTNLLSSARSLSVGDKAGAKFFVKLARKDIGIFLLELVKFEEELQQQGLAGNMAANLEMMEKLASWQQKLSSELQKSVGMPVPLPSLKRMAAEQRLIGQLMQSLSGFGKAEAEQIAKLIEQGRLKEAVEKQKKLRENFMEFIKSRRKKGFEKRRVSRPGEDVFSKARFTPVGQRAKRIYIFWNPESIPSEFREQVKKYFEEIEQ